MQMKVARNYSQNAASYGQAAQGMIRGDDLSQQLQPAFYLLVGFALELGLKSLCLSSGMTLKDVRRIGHDLSALQSAIKVRKLPDFKTDLHLLIETIGPLHKDLWFRYTPERVNVIPVPPPNKCIGPVMYLTWLADEAAWSPVPPATDFTRLHD